MLSLLSFQKPVEFTPFELKKWLIHHSFSKQKKIMGDIVFSPYLSFETYRLFIKAQKQLTKNLRLEIMPKSTITSGVQYREDILRGYTPLLYLDSVANVPGRGVFAEEMIFTGSFVMEYTGVVKKRSRSVLNDNDYCLSYPVHPLKRDYVIDAKEKGNLSRFINHSAKGNLDLKMVVVDGILHMVFFAIKDIQPHEQLTFDYGYLYWKDQTLEPVEL